jgi:hypothetical protein
VIDGNHGNTAAGGNRTATISERVRVDAPTVIRLQAQRFDARGTASIAQIYSDARGYTSLGCNRVTS